MSNNPAPAAQGEMTLRIAVETQFFKFAIHPDGIQFRRRQSGSGPISAPQSLFDLLGFAEPTLLKGYVGFAGLPASPSDAFHHLTLDYKNDVFTLNVSEEGPFGERANFKLKQLDLNFIQRRGLERLIVSGSLMAEVMGQDVTLAPTFTGEGWLVFRPAGAGLFRQPPFQIDALGSLNLSNLEIGASYDRWADLQVLFAFVEGVGTAIHDTSHAVNPASPDVDTAQRLMTACRTANEITIEAWVKPKTISRGIIVNLSKDSENRYFALAQGDENDQPANRFQARLRSGEGVVEVPVIVTPPGVSTNTPSCLALTRNASGKTDLYLNGASTNAEKLNIPRTLDWIGNYRLSVGKDPTGEQRWDGEIHRIAIYSRAISDERARLNHHPQAIIRDRGTLSSTGRFTFPASPEAIASGLSPIFNGRIALRGETTGEDTPVFQLQGRLEIFPEWSPLQISADLSAPGGPATLVNRTGGIELLRQPASVQLRDFQLLESVLNLKDGKVTLTGRWLGQVVVFTAEDRAGEFILRAADVTFTVPNSRLGPITETVTGAQLAESVDIQQITAAFEIELSSAGFLAKANIAFKWIDEASVAHDVTARTVTLFAPPPTRNVLSGLMLSEMRRQANALLAERLKHSHDYYFLSSTAPVAGPLMLFYGTTSTALAMDIKTKLPELLTTALSASIVSAPPIFTLAKSTPGFELSISLAGEPAGSRRSFDEIKTAYLDFVKQLEGAGGVTLQPGAVEIVKTRIAERLPMTFSQVLFYHYGFLPETNQIDLQPGMRLRVDYQHYQLVHPSDLTALDGYVGGGSVYYHISSLLAPSTNGAAQLKLGFDGFLSGLQSRITTDLTNVGAAGVIDLQQTAFRRRYFRLLYPSQITGPGARGWTGTERVAAIIGADRLTDLAEATRLFLSGEGNLTTDSRVAFSFRGRATVIPEICVFVQDQPLYVAVGTTVRQILERYADIPIAGMSGQDLKAFHGRLRPRRLVHEGENSVPTYKFIDFNNYAAFGATDIYDLPVVKGDRYYF